MQSYLDAIHDHNDRAVTVQALRSFETPRYGTLAIYRYHSDYWRERLAVFIVYQGIHVHIELYAPGFTDAERYMPTLEEIARSVSINAAF